MTAAQGKTAVVLGASGGLGSALLAALRRDADYHHVIALSRSAPPPDDALWFQVDAADPASLGPIAARIGAAHPRIHLFLSCIGTLHDGDLHSRFRPEKALGDLQLDNLERAMTVNAYAPLAALSAFAGLLKHEQGAVVAILSAMVGSIADNRVGGWYSYRMSKAALNMGVRNAAIEFARMRNGPTVVAIHPGTTLTRLSEPFVRRHKHRSAEESAGCILNVIGALTSQDSGRFYNWDGQQLPW